jgi:hypothetical protein
MTSIKTLFKKAILGSAVLVLSLFLTPHVQGAEDDTHGAGAGQQSATVQCEKALRPLLDLSVSQQFRDLRLLAADAQYLLLAMVDEIMDAPRHVVELKRILATAIQISAQLREDLLQARVSLGVHFSRADLQTYYREHFNLMSVFENLQLTLNMMLPQSGDELIDLLETNNGQALIHANYETLVNSIPNYVSVDTTEVHDSAMTSVSDQIKSRIPFILDQSNHDIVEIMNGYLSQVRSVRRRMQNLFERDLARNPRYLSGRMGQLIRSKIFIIEMYEYRLSLLRSLLLVRNASIDKAFKRVLTTLSFQLARVPWTMAYGPTELINTMYYQYITKQREVRRELGDHAVGAIQWSYEQFRALFQPAYATEADAAVDIVGDFYTHVDEGLYAYVYNIALHRGLFVLVGQYININNRPVLVDRVIQTDEGPMLIIRSGRGYDSYLLTPADVGTLTQSIPSANDSGPDWGSGSLDLN